MSQQAAIQGSEYLSLLCLAFRNGLLDSHIKDTISVTVRDGPKRRAEFRKLIAGILFSRQFILSYQLVLLCLLLTYASLHWLSRLRARQRRVRRDRRDDVFKTGRSSSSSTLNADCDALEPYPKMDEQSPLLLTGGGKRIFRSKLVGRIQAWLVYQPSPIPVVNKILPSNGCTFVVLAFLGLQVFYTFYKVHLSLPLLFVFADRTALLFVANLPLLYLFAAKNQPIKFLTGYSYESLNILHRRLGEVMCLLALLHSLGMLGVWYTILRPGGSTLISFISSKIILLGKSLQSSFLGFPRFRRKSSNSTLGRVRNS